MGDLAARLTVRAALCAAPSTPCSADEVAYALGRRDRLAAAVSRLGAAPRVIDMRRCREEG